MARVEWARAARRGPAAQAGARTADTEPQAHHQRGKVEGASRRQRQRQLHRGQSPGQHGGWGSPSCGLSLEVSKVGHLNRWETTYETREEQGSQTDCLAQGGRLQGKRQQLFDPRTAPAGTTYQDEAETLPRKKLTQTRAQQRQPTQPTATVPPKRAGPEAQDSLWAASPGTATTRELCPAKGWRLMKPSW